MAVYLPLLTALLAGVGMAGGSVTLLIALGTVGLVLYLALRHGRLISRAVNSDNAGDAAARRPRPDAAGRGIAQKLQVSAAVGAFLVGIALSGETAENARALLTPLRDLFAAVFFVFFGLSTDPAEIPPVLAARAAARRRHDLTKIITGWYAARRAGISSAGRLRAGGALVARGEFSIVIAGLAVSAEPRHRAARHGLRPAPGHRRPAGRPLDGARRRRAARAAATAAAGERVTRSPRPAEAPEPLKR